jgi:hypothetical protein
MRLFQNWKRKITEGLSPGMDRCPCPLLNQYISSSALFLKGDLYDCMQLFLKALKVLMAAHQSVIFQLTRVHGPLRQAPIFLAPYRTFNRLPRQPQSLNPRLRTRRAFPAYNIPFQVPQLLLVPPMAPFRKPCPPMVKTLII